MVVLNLVLLLLSGCQSATKHNNSSTSYGQYYLTLQQLNQQQLTDEVSKQQKALEEPTKKKAAKIAQRNLTEFYKLLKRHHLSAEAFREE
jgi:uncharacterized protein YceK